MTMMTGMTVMDFAVMNFTVMDFAMMRADRVSYALMMTGAMVRFDRMMTYSDMVCTMHGMARCKRMMTNRVAMGRSATGLMVGFYCMRMTGMHGMFFIRMLARAVFFVAMMRPAMSMMACCRVLRWMLHHIAIMHRDGMAVGRRTNNG
jgi:hypothetical protein